MLSFLRVHECRTPPDDRAITGVPTRSDLSAVDDGRGPGPAERQPDLASVADGGGDHRADGRAADVAPRGEDLAGHQSVVPVQGGADLVVAVEDQRDPVADV